MTICLKWQKRKRFKPLFTLFMILFLVACKKEPDPILSNLDCELPCWGGVQLGVSNREETLSLLKKIPEVDQESIIADGKPWNIFDDVIYFGFNNKKISGRVYFTKDKASHIGLFDNSNKSLDTTFDDALRLLGEPKYIYNLPATGGVPGAPTDSNIIYAIHPETGFGFSLDMRHQPASSRAELTPESKLGGVFFFDPEFLEQLLDAGFFSLYRLDPD